MGIRPNKVVGWTVEVPLADIDKDVLETVLEEKYTQKRNEKYTYHGFYDFIAPYAAGDFIQSLDPYKEKLEQYNMLDFVDIIHDDTEFMDAEEIQNASIYVVFHPMFLTPYIFPDTMNPVADFQSFDSPFVYAELERFFPEEFAKISIATFDFTTPVFPTQYSVIKNGLPQDMQNFQKYDDKENNMEVYASLLHMNTPDKRYAADLKAKFAGFKDADDLASQWQLAPPTDLFMFAQYTGVFQDESVPYMMTPKVVYYWA